MFVWLILSQVRQDFLLESLQGTHLYFCFSGVLMSPVMSRSLKFDAFCTQFESVPDLLDFSSSLPVGVSFVAPGLSF